MILFCTSSDQIDPSLQSVREAIVSKGGDVVHFEADRVPADRSLSVEWNDIDLIRLDCREGEVASHDISAVWMRHFEPGAQPPEGIDPDFAHAVALQTEVLVWDMLACLDVFMLDPPGPLRHAPQKVRQLQLARSLGINIPKTLATNNPEAVRRFAKTCPNGVITKLPDSAMVFAEGDEGEEPIYTRRMTDEELEHLEGLELCPMLFQEFVPKHKELRLTVVGHQIFAAAIGGQGTESLDDWRSDSQSVSSFEPYPSLPDSLHKKILQLFDAIGLNFGTVDLILTPDGKYVFLELNSISYFDFVEQSTGLPISDAIADLLLGHAKPRV
ncbi:MAG: MvdD family ATP-grasp ribosomal peptide maturase [Deltaproteobacteria bacterium]|nr:MAG: MvdD family ATP-grasp ribosomal peptide maturase [Deltaproteobacteria bacterium]